MCFHKYIFVAYVYLIHLCLLQVPRSINFLIVGNKNIDTVKVSKICTHDLNAEIIRAWYIFWLTDRVDVFVAVHLVAMVTSPAVVNKSMCLSGPNPLTLALVRVIRQSFYDLSPKRANKYNIASIFVTKRAYQICLLSYGD